MVALRGLRGAKIVARADDMAADVDGRSGL